MTSRLIEEALFLSPSAFETHLKEKVAERSQLSQMMRYQLGFEDEKGDPLIGGAPDRLRAPLCFLSAAILGADYNKAMPYAIAVELAQAGLAIHQDVQDGLPERDSRQTVWWVWGPAHGINAGSAMIAMARREISSTESMPAIHAFDNAMLAYTTGMYWHRNFIQQTDVKPEPFAKMLEGTAGAMFGFAMESGATAAGAGKGAAQSFGHAGAALGVAHHLQLEHTELWGKDAIKRRPQVFLSGRKTYALAVALSKLEGKERVDLIGALRRWGSNDEEMAKAVTLIEGAGAKEACEQSIAAHVQRAHGLLTAGGASAEAAAQVMGMVKGKLGLA